jgi:hypothetical protein
VDGVVDAQHVQPTPQGEAGWLQETRTPDGKRLTVAAEYDLHLNHYGSARVTITAPEGSEMARIMGKEQVEPFAPSPHWTEEFNLTRTVTEVRG